jgi:hypothetical protein
MQGGNPLSLSVRDILLQLYFLKFRFVKFIKKCDFIISKPIIKEYL